MLKVKAFTVRYFKPKFNEDEGTLKEPIVFEEATIKETDIERALAYAVENLGSVFYIAEKELE